MINALKLTDADNDAYFESLETANGTTQHQMCGYSRPVQSEMELECDFLRRGEKARWDLPDERFIAAAQNWILLLQVDTDDYKEGPGWMWGDAGMVYFWIHRGDLASQAFNCAIAIEQGH